MTLGRVRFSSHTAYEPEVSLPSAGRSISMLGVARINGMVSMGWCVGPSSPNSMESWVAMYRTPNLESAVSLTAPHPYVTKLRKVAQKGRNPPYANNPLTIADMPCSRTPKRIYLFPCSPVAKLPSPFKPLLLDSSRSAEPPMSSGRNEWTALRDVCDRLRVAAGASFGVYLGISDFQLSGSLPSNLRVISLASSGYCCEYLLKSACHSSYFFSPSSHLPR
mmetsp:Transcript_47355/g.118247  ORF Transcript_47355/g.118247 Transcript_47355/m.118247 type:complete len:221 (-) Transcript_47355:1024-1686(-)